MEGGARMDSNTFYIIEIMEKSRGGTAAYVKIVNNSYNLIGLFDPAKNYQLLSVNACKTKKEAQKIADFWNEAARAKNNCLY